MRERRVRKAGLLEATGAENAGIAFAAGAAGCIGIVATEGDLEGNSEFVAEANDLCFGKGDQRRVDLRSESSFDAAFGRKIGHGFEGVDELRSAIRVTGIIESVHADEDVGGAEDLSGCQGE